MARPYTKDESTCSKKDFLESFESHAGAVVLTCRTMKINPSTYSYWREHDPEFNEAVLQIKEAIKDKVEYSLIRDAIKKGGTDRIFYMKCQMRDRGYIERPDQSFTDPVTDFRINQVDLDIINKIKQDAIKEYQNSQKTDETTNS